jgi:hypothetical protein
VEGTPAYLSTLLDQVEGTQAYISTLLAQVECMPISAGQSRSGRSEITDANEEDFNEDENIDIYDDPSCTHQGIILHLTTYKKNRQNKKIQHTENINTQFLPALECADLNKNLS